MGMASFIFRRLLSLLFVLFAVSIITFIIMNAVPGGPFDVGTERPLPEEIKEAMLRKYGLDKPPLERYLNFLIGAVTLDFGNSFQIPSRTVMQLIGEKWPITAHVGLYTVTFAFTFGLMFGLIAAYYQGSWLDNALTFFSTLTVTIPRFVVAIWLLIIFSLTLGWLPMRGWSQPQNFVIPGIFSTDWILPVVAYGLAFIGVIARYTRSSIVDALTADYVRTARAKGLRDRTIMLRHVLKNAMIPMVTIMLPIVPDLMTGSIFIEATFSIPGLGRYFVSSMTNRDYPMIMALMLMIAFIMGMVYLITDIVYTWLDPRVRFSGQEAG